MSNKKGKNMESTVSTKSNNRLVYTIAEVGQILGLSENSVRKAIREGSISHKRIGGRIIIPIKSFHEEMEL